MPMEGKNLRIRDYAKVFIIDSINKINQIVPKNKNHQR